MKLRASNRFHSSALISTGFALSLCFAQAADIIKDNNANSLNLGTSWVDDLLNDPTDDGPGTGDVAVWNSTVTAANTVTLGADLSWLGLKIANPGGAVSILTGNTLTLGTAGIDMSAATQNLTLVSPVVLGTAQTWSVGTSRTLTASGVVSGTGTLNKTGVGQLTLSNANTFNNGFTISAGTVVAGNNAAFGTGTLTLGGGAFTTSGVRTFTNAINVAASTTTNVFGYNGGSNYPVLNGAITGSGTITNHNTLGGLGNVLINGDISGFTGTISYNNTNGGNNFQFNSGAAASINGSQAKFVASGNTTNSPGQWLFNNIGTGTFKMGSLSGTGGNITGNSTNVTFEVGALNSDTSFAGTIRQASGTTNLSKVGTGRLELTGTNTYNGSTTINDGTLALTQNAALPGSVSLAAANTPTLQLTAPLIGDSWTFTRQINGGSADAKVEKTGLGRVILTPAASSNFVGSSIGTLTVTQGRLDLNSAGLTTAPTVSVASGAVFGGTSAAGAVTVSDGGAVAGGSGGLGTLTAASLTFNNTGTLNGMLSAGVTPIVVTGTLTASGGSGSISITPLNVPVSGTYHLLQFGDFPGSLGDFKFTQPTRGMALELNGSFLDVVVNSSVSFPIWTGGGSGEWSHAAGLGNWKLASDSTPTDFFALDNVLFDDTATGSTDVVVGVASLNAGLITFNNSGKNYTLTQANGRDIASGSLVKTGSGKVTIAGSFSFAGGSTLGGGTVSINDETSLGLGSRVLNGSTLEYTGPTATWTRNIALEAGGGIAVTNPGAVVTHSGAITGTGPLAKSGEGALSLTLAAGTYVNDLAVNGGRLDLNYGANAVTLSGDISGSGILSLTGTGASGTTGITFTGDNTFSGETHLYGRRVFLNSATTNGALGGDIVIKQGNWAFHCLSIMANEQIADTAVLRFEQTDNAYDFRLNGKTETLAGITSLGSGQGTAGADGSFCIIENAGHDGGDDNNIPAGKLIVTGSGEYLYHGTLRNQNGGTGNGPLSFTKAGTGTQTLHGIRISYTGNTEVNGGMLVLDSASNFASPSVTVQSGGTLQMKGTTTLSNTAALNILAGATLKTGSDGADYHVVPAAQTLTGGGTVNGKLLVSGTVAPGDSPGTLTVTGFCDFNPGSKIQWQVGGSWAAPAADLIQCQSYAILANDTNPIVITISPDSVTGFTEEAKTITLIQGTELGLDFAEDKFQINASAFATATGATGTWEIQENGNNLELTYTPGAPLTAFESWADSWTNPALSDKTSTGDPDGDGLTNLQEFLFGTAPNAGTGSLMTTEQTGGNLVIRWLQRETGATYTLKQNAALAGSWTDVISPIPASDGDQGGVPTDYDRFKVTLPIGATKDFFRIQGVEN